MSLSLEGISSAFNPEPMHFRASGTNCILDDVQRYCNPVKQNTTISPSMTPLPTPAPAIQPSSGTSSPRTAPIVGGSIAGMAFLLAIVIWLAVRRRVRRPHRVQDSDQSASDAHLTPFTQQLGHLREGSQFCVTFHFLSFSAERLKS